MHNPSFDVVSIERPWNFVVDLVDERNAERELVSRSFVRFCPRVPVVRAFNLLDHVGGVSVVNLSLVTTVLVEQVMFSTLLFVLARFSSFFTMATFVDSGWCDSKCSVICLLAVFVCSRWERAGECRLCCFSRNGPSLVLQAFR